MVVWDENAPGGYWIGRENNMGLTIFWYGDDGTQYTGGICPSGPYVWWNNETFTPCSTRYVHYTISDVFFRGDGNMICWNVTQTNSSISFDAGGVEAFVNMSVDYTFSV